MDGARFQALLSTLSREDSRVRVDHGEHGRWLVETGSFRRQGGSAPKAPSVPLAPTAPLSIPDFPAAAHDLGDSEALALEGLPDLPDPDEGLPAPTAVEGTGPEPQDGGRG